MLMSRYRANSFRVAAAHPSTMLFAMESAALVSWVLNSVFPGCEIARAHARICTENACARCQTFSFLKSCMRQTGELDALGRHQTNAVGATPFLAAALSGPGSSRD